MIHLHPALAAAILMLAFALTDRFTGGGLGWDKLAHDHGGPLHGRGIYYAGPVLIAVAYAVGGTMAAVLAFAWTLYRAAFSFPDGTLTGRDFNTTVLRHALLWPVAAALVLAFHLDPIALLPLAGYTAVAVVLAKWNGDEALDSLHPRDVNWLVELTRGGAFGLALAGFLRLA